MASLILSSAKGDSQAVLGLLFKGVDPEEIHTGLTALGVAAMNGHEEVIRILVKSGANVNIQDSYQHTALMCASVRGHESIIRYLVENGANIDLQDTLGWTALMNASCRAHEGIVRILIEANADCNIATGRGKTALMYGAENLIRQPEMSISIIQRLLKADADTSAKDNMGKTFLDYIPEIYRKQVQDIVDELNGYMCNQLK